MKRMYFSALTALFSVLLFVATVSIKPACFTWFYQPEIPRALKK
ncbi:cyclic lactone autoinducer peptide [Desulfofundulus salinus]|uniref:Cyclic lactone autoinducer peptide n=1 Tax=Desulfofundulus salinus TaxID=2419843 RepID=A0A494WTL2_9FIRM|nr:cyclic lactone autoinducer peptide [Desulfofundulus salinum]